MVVPTVLDCVSLVLPGQMDAVYVCLHGPLRFVYTLRHWFYIRATPCCVYQRFLVHRSFCVWLVGLRLPFPRAFVSVCVLVSRLTFLGLDHRTWIILRHVCAGLRSFGPAFTPRTDGFTAGHISPPFTVLPAWRFPGSRFAWTFYWFRACHQFSHGLRTVAHTHYTTRPTGSVISTLGEYDVVHYVVYVLLPTTYNSFFIYVPFIGDSSLPLRSSLHISRTRPAPHYTPTNRLLSFGGGGGRRKIVPAHNSCLCPFLPTHILHFPHMLVTRFAFCICIHSEMTFLSPFILWRGGDGDVVYFPLCPHHDLPTVMEGGLLLLFFPTTTFPYYIFLPTLMIR